MVGASRHLLLDPIAHLISSDEEPDPKPRSVIGAGILYLHGVVVKSNQVIVSTQSRKSPLLCKIETSSFEAGMGVRERQEMAFEFLAPRTAHRSSPDGMREFTACQMGLSGNCASAGEHRSVAARPGLSPAASARLWLAAGPPASGFCVR